MGPGRGYERSAGHVEGVTTVRRITEEASALGIRYLTLYTFSTENWQRPQAEVDALMTLIVTAIERETPDLIKNNVRLTTIGDLDRMPSFAAERMRKCIAYTSHCTGLTLVLALSYSSRWEIVKATRELARPPPKAKSMPTTSTRQCLPRTSRRPRCPDPDLLIRTGAT